MRAIGYEKFLPYIPQIGTDAFDQDELMHYQFIKTAALNGWASKSFFIVKMSNDEFVFGNITNNEVYSISNTKNTHTFSNFPAVISILNALHLPSNSEVLTQLSKSYIFYNEGQYGSVIEIGSPIYEYGDPDSNVGKVSVYIVETAFYVIRTRNDQPDDGKNHTSMYFIVSGNKIVEFDYDDALLTDPEIAIILNKIKMRVSDDVERLLYQFSVFTDNTKFGDLKQVGIKEKTFGDDTLYRLGKRKKWIVNAPNGSYDIVLDRKNVMSSESPRFLVTEPIKFLIKKYEVAGVYGAENYGIMNFNNGPIGEVSDLLKNLPELQSRYTPFYYLEDNTFKNFLLNVKLTITKSQTNTLLKAFRPDPKHLVKYDITETSHVFDLEIPHYHIILPSTCIFICDTLEIDDNIPKPLIDDFTKALKSATKFVKESPPAYFDLVYSKVKYMND